MDQSHNKPVLVFKEERIDLCLEAMVMLQEMLLLENIDAYIFRGDRWQDVYALEAFHRADIVLTRLQDLPRDLNFCEVVVSSFAMDGELYFRVGDCDYLARDFWHLYEKLQRMYGPPPLVGCVLIGGKSSRMGQAKHLLQSRDGQTWLEKTVARLKPYVTEVVVAGAGDLPQSLMGLRRIADAGGIAGPLGGIVGACRAFPRNSWLLVACDMPLVSDMAIEWLLTHRALGRWAVVPMRESLAAGKTLGFKRVEPLFACYESQSGFLFERLVEEKTLQISAVAEDEKVHLLSIPPELELAWTNANTPEDVSSL
ncbi:molybdenum cofactor guanylyltransferase [Desulfotalea psychrophila]|uniref:MobA-like NTP transferase domain-containing protein n=1 Tax=Desulfotalea psychrophila (strain LSv54 / DSM 12343) TaxID=177439 RepID=Q6AJA9_DESPS|nr:molybdenum cofactor guanylyltransferase [Desulfotalea psychrophila]CAG37571.1 unknown protein [Desulfotalea psychrophila LSv54]